MNRLCSTAGVAGVIAVWLIAVAGAIVASGADIARAGGCQPVGPTSSGSGGTTVAMRDCAFVPAIIEIQAGTTVTFVNEDYAPHRVDGRALEWGLQGKDLTSGGRFSHQFMWAGTYPYDCNIHLGMVGVILVTDGGPTAEQPSAAVAKVTPRPEEPASATAEQRRDVQLTGTYTGDEAGPGWAGAVGLALGGASLGLVAGVGGMALRRRS